MPGKTNNKKNKPTKIQVVKVVKQKKIKKNRKNKPSMLSSMASVVGNVLGNVGRSALGPFGSLVPTIASGSGAYRVRNVIKSNTLVKGGPPSFADPRKGIRVAHREYIGDVISSLGYNNTTYDINPINSTTFPWMSIQASGYEEYEFKGLIFEYVTTSGSAIASTNNTLGIVGMVAVTDPTDAPLGSKKEAEGYSGVMANSTACSFEEPVECAPRSAVLSRLYMQTTNLSNAEDKKFYSFGTLNVFTQGQQQAGLTIGELWVTYDVIFYTPKILPIGLIKQAADRYIGSAVTTASINKMMGTANLTPNFGNLGSSYSGSTGLLTITAGSSSGYYLVGYWVFTGAAGDTGLPDINASGSNMSRLSIWDNSTIAADYAPTSAVASARRMVWALFNKSDTSAGSVLISSSSAPTSPVDFDVFIVKMPPAFVASSSGGPFAEKPPVKPLDLSLLPSEQLDQLLHLLQLRQTERSNGDRSETEIMDGLVFAPELEHDIPLHKEGLYSRKGTPLLQLKKRADKG
jgi:hypothetical protein